MPLTCRRTRFDQIVNTVTPDRRRAKDQIFSSKVFNRFT